MSTIKSSTEHLTLNADGSGKDIKFQANGVEVASISSTGNLTSTGIDDNATSTAITIDASENVGIGTTPAPWSSAGKLEVSGMGTSNQYSDSVSNAYYNSGWKYKTTGGATNIERNASSMYFRVAPSGTADSTISWTTALTITNDGRGLSQFTAKAWCHYEDDGGSDFNSHNISSITVVSTGKYTANFTNSMANTLYSAVVFNEDGSGYNDEFYAAHDTADARSVSQYGFWTGNIGPNSANTFNLMVFGD